MAVSYPKKRRKVVPKRKSSISKAMQAIKADNVKNKYCEKDLTFSVISCEKEKNECMQLAYQEYLKKNYIEESEVEANGFEKMKTIFDNVGQSIIFKAELHKKIVGTITINFDAELGLPLDSEFPEVNSLFKRGVSEISEVTRLAISEGVENSKDIINGLFNAVTLDLVSTSKNKCLLIEVNPRHQFFYKKKMLFKQLVESRPCQRVSGAPAVLLSLSKDDCQYAYLNSQNDESIKRTLYVNFKMDKRIIEEIKDSKQVMV
ncbi:MAG: hypothetical protein COA79_20005 [Planctomycetota bacterium]|nr:MAG: hypothetical protein COA79_20005 [Planctomycetota bacterium]